MHNTSRLNVMNQTHLSTTIHIALMFGLFLAVAWMLYGFTIAYPYQFDDYANIVNQPNRLALSQFAQIDTWLHPTNRAMSFLSFGLQDATGQANPATYRWLNITIHAVNGFLLWLLVSVLCRISPQVKILQNKQIPLISALLFLVHPLQTQSVTYIVQRMASLAAMFTILSVLLYVKARWTHLQSGWRRQVVLLYVTAGIAMFLAVQSKENAASIPVLFWLMEFCFIQPHYQNQKGKVILWCVALAMIASFTGLFLSYQMPKEVMMGRWATYVMTQPVVLLRALLLLLLPYRQNVDYFIPTATSLFTWQSILFFVIIGFGLIRAVIEYRKNNPLLLFVIGWFFATIAIESIIPLPDMFFEHRLYLPLVAYAIGLAVLLSSAARTKGWSWLIIVLLIGYASTTVMRNYTWHSEVSLWEDTTAKSPTKSRPWRMLGDAYLKQQDYSKALAAYQQALSLQPDNMEIEANLAATYVAAGNVSQAVSIYQSVLQKDPNQAQIWFNYGDAKKKLSDYSEAIKALHTAIKLDSSFADAWYNLADCYRLAGNKSKSNEFFNIALSRWPNHPLAAQVQAMQQPSSNGNPNIQVATTGNSFYAQGQQAQIAGDLTKAIALWKKEIKTNPTNINALNDIGTAYYSKQQFKEAISYWEKSLTVDTNQAHVYSLIGSAWYQLQDTAKLISFYKKAARLGDSQAQQALRSKNIAW